MVSDGEVEQEADYSFGLLVGRMPWIGRVWVFGAASILCFGSAARLPIR